MRDYSRQSFLGNGQEINPKRNRNISGGGNSKKRWWILVVFALLFLSVRKIRIVIKENKEREIVFENIETSEKGAKEMGVVSQKESYDIIEIEKASDASETILRIKEKLSGKVGEYSLWVESFWDGEVYGFNYEKEHTAASINKVPILVEYLLSEEEEKVSFSDVYKLSSQDMEGGSGTLQYKKIGSKHTHRELLGLIGQYSDNAATNAIVRELGRDNIQGLCDDLGMDKTNIFKNKTSAFDIGTLFSGVYKGTIFGSESSRQVFYDVLTNTEYEERIPAGVAENIQVVHKIGNQIQVWSDCGLVLGKRAYSICILTDGIRESEAKELVPYISKKVWEYESEKE